MGDVGATAGAERDVTIRRRIAAAVLVVLNLAALFFVAVSWLGSSDDDSWGDLAAAATATIGGAMALVTLLATAVPVRLRWLRAWWLAIPAALILLAALRLILVR